MKVWVSTGLALAALSVFAEPVPVALYKQDIVMFDDDQEFTLYVVKPVDHGRIGAADAELEMLTDYLYQKTKANGYLNDRTTPHYLREFETLRQGRWPTIFLTPLGSREISLNLTYAIRYDDSPLPCESRFYMQTPYFMDPLPAVHRVSVGSILPVFLHYPFLNAPPNDAYLQTLLQRRPVSDGEKVEGKFLEGEYPDPVRLLPIFHRFTTDLELARYSRRRVPPEHYEKMARWVKNQKLDRFPLDLPRFDKYYDYPTEWDERLTEYIHKNLFAPQWQPYVRNEHIYFHVSGRQIRPGATTTARGKLMRALGLPEEPEIAFEENNHFGTDGVYTEIFGMTQGYFETVMRAHLEERAGYDSRREPGGENPSREVAHDFCQYYLSAMESDIYHAVGD